MLVADDPKHHVFNGQNGYAEMDPFAPCVPPPAPTAHTFHYKRRERVHQFVAANPTVPGRPSLQCTKRGRGNATLAGASAREFGAYVNRAGRHVAYGLLTQA